MNVMINENVVKECIVIGNSFSAFISEKTVHVAYGIDNKFIMPAGISIVSIIENNKDIDFVFHILIDDISENNIEKFRLITNKYPRVLIHIHIIDIHGLMSLPTSKRYSLAVYYRLYIAQVIPDYVKKILYIDADIICLHSLQTLINVDIENAVVAAACERIVTMDKKDFNSGVLYMNLELWRGDDIPKQLDDFFQRESILFFYDQDALNSVLKNKVHFLERKYNYMLDNIEREIPNDTILLHYCDEKPWRAWYDKKDKNHFDYYKRMSPWKDVPDELPSDYQQWKYMGHHWLRKHKYLQALKCYWQYSVDKLKERM